MTEKADAERLTEFLAANYRSARTDTSGIVQAMKDSPSFRQEVGRALGQFDRVSSRCAISKTHADFLRRATGAANG